MLSAHRFRQHIHRVKLPIKRATNPPNLMLQIVCAGGTTWVAGLLPSVRRVRNRQRGTVNHSALNPSVSNMAANVRTGAIFIGVL